MDIITSMSFILIVLVEITCDGKRLFEGDASIITQALKLPQPSETSCGSTRSTNTSCRPFGTACVRFYGLDAALPCFCLLEGLLGNAVAIASAAADSPLIRVSLRSSATSCTKEQASEGKLSRPVPRPFERTRAFSLPIGAANRPPACDLRPTRLPATRPVDPRRGRRSGRRRSVLASCSSGISGHPQ